MHNGDRVSQTVDAITTTYVLDTTSALTEVLSQTMDSQTTSYWQGLAPVAQNDGTSPSYFQYDGLGSVRRVTIRANWDDFTQANRYAYLGEQSQLHM